MRAVERRGISGILDSRSTNDCGIRSAMAHITE